MKIKTKPLLVQRSVINLKTNNDEFIIKKYEYVKQEKESFSFEIPNEPVYLFQTGVRRSIRIIPEWTTWQKQQQNKDEEIFRLIITCVYNSSECKIEQFNINISELETIYYLKESNNSEHISYVIKYWINDDLNKRTKEQFNGDLQEALDKINLK